VGAASDLRKQHPDAIPLDLGDSLLMPGLVNPHTHLELSKCSRDPRNDEFADWIMSLPRRLGRDRFTAEEIYPAAAREGIAQSLRYGVTSVGDISQRVDLTRPMLAESPLRVVSYGEVLGLAKLKRRFEELLPRAIDRRFDSMRFHTGLTPHAPYTVDLPSYRRCLELARDSTLPLATHLAETLEEEEFLRHHTGGFREIFDRLGAWEEPVETYAGSPIEFANAIGLLEYPTLLAHVNYCSDEEMGLLAKGQASVVYCPRTHKYFGHPPHRFREMLAAGINVALGTDSCASSPNLNILDDLRLVHEIHPEIPAEQLFPLVTINAARALQLENETGSLSAGKQADIATFAIVSDNPLRELLESAAAPQHLWIGGAQVY